MAELPGINLLDELRGGAFEAAICTSYNVSFPFFEEVVLRRLRSSGCRHVVLMADASRVAEELASAARRPSYAGAVYTLAPVTADAAFHPKLLVLVGAKKARLYIGSHNVSYAGFSRNIEVTNRIDVAGKEDRVGARLLDDVLSWLQRIAGDQTAAVQEAVRATGAFAEWRGGPGPISDVFFLAAERTGPSIFERLRERCPARVERVVVAAPFFDGDLRFLAHLRATFAGRIVVGIDPSHAQIAAQRARALDITFVDAPRALSADGALHAKAMLIEGVGHDSVLVTGSANASAVAWLAHDGAGNIEAVLGRVGKTDDLDAPLGLRRLADAPALSGDDWARIERRVAERDREAGESAPAASPALCFEERGGLLVTPVQRVPGTPTRVDAISGDSLTSLHWVVRDGELRVTPPATAFQLLRVEHERGVSWAVCHQTEQIRSLAEPSARRRLREALGSMHEIDHIEEALHAAEKVIFDDETVFRPRVVRAGAAGTDEAPATVEMASGSLAIPMASDDRVEARRKRVARDDLAMLLDAVLRALHRELASTTTAGPSDQELANDDAAPPDSDADAQVIDAQKLERLAAIVRRKSKTLMSRLRKIVGGAAAQEDADAGRAVVRAVAVLGLLFALRRAEERPMWRKDGCQLVDREALAALGPAIVPPLFSTNGLLARARADGDDDAEELDDLPGLLVWWGWVACVDGPPLPDDDNAGAVAEGLAAALVARAAVATHDQNGERVTDRARACPRPGVSPRGWWDALSAAAQRVSASAAPSAPRRFKEGELVRAGPQQRAGVVTAVRGTTLEIADLTDGGVIRRFKEGHVRGVPWAEAADMARGDRR